MGEGVAEKQGKQKTEIEKSLFADFLNSKLEKIHSKVFYTKYVHDLLSYNFQGRGWRENRPEGARAYKNRFLDILECNENRNRNQYFDEFKEKAQADMDIFNKKSEVDKDAETNSFSSFSTANAANF